MRIVGGSFRGRRLAGPGRGKAQVRPTADRAREAIFQVLGGTVAGAAVVDLFAGTGAMGLEAASRGAAQVIFVENSRAMLSVIRQNISACLPDVASVRRESPHACRLHSSTCDFILVQADLVRPFTRSQVCAANATAIDLIFCDPPYGWNHLDQLLQQIGRAGLMAGDGKLVVETETGARLPERCGALALCDTRRYGAACFWTYISW